MPYQATVFQVMIASPSDVSEYRKIARDVLHNWNDEHSNSRKIILQPIGWEFNAYPATGKRPQEFINKQILERADLLVGIFWTRIGTPTGEFLSGSVEEINKHTSAGKPAMLFFINSPAEIESLDFDQIESLKKFKNELSSNALYETAGSLDEFERIFRSKLNLSLNDDEYFLKNQLAKNVPESKAKDSLEGIIMELSEEEKLAIIETSKDRHGQLGKIPMMGDYIVQANNKKLNIGTTPRTKALWEQAFENLKVKRIIRPTGQDGKMFALTPLGYDIADKLKESQNP